MDLLFFSASIFIWNAFLCNYLTLILAQADADIALIFGRSEKTILEIWLGSGESSCADWWVSRQQWTVLPGSFHPILHLLLFQLSIKPHRKWSHMTRADLTYSTPIFGVVWVTIISHQIHCDVAWAFWRCKSNWTFEDNVLSAIFADWEWLLLHPRGPGARLSVVGNTDSCWLIVCSNEVALDV